jgi:hypothetical protein
MAMDERYTDPDGLKRELAELKAQRDSERDRLKAHLHALLDKERRGLLMKDAVHDVLRSTRLFKWVARLLRNWDR